MRAVIARRELVQDAALSAPEEFSNDTDRFVAALKSSLTDGPLDQRQGAIRRCIEQIVVNRKEGYCRVLVRRIPTIAGESLVTATDQTIVRFREVSGAVS